MPTYYEKFVQLQADYAAYLVYVGTLQAGAVDVRMMELFFNKDFYLDTVPVIPAIATIDMRNVGGSILYTVPELALINDIYNFFGAESYPIGRKFSEFARFYRTRFDEGLIDTMDAIKLDYGIP